MTLCLFGGAFNPPHRTHERVIRTAQAQLRPTRLIILPTGSHPLKADHGLAPARVRLELCELAFGDLDGVELSDWELRRGGPSYTIETVRHFREYLTGGDRPYWIIGSDNLAILPSWHRHHELMELAVLVTCPREGYPIDDTTFEELDLTPRERAAIEAHVLVMEPDRVSATELRAAIGRGEPTDDWLHPAVARRIAELGLYRDDHPTEPPPDDR